MTCPVCRGGGDPDCPCEGTGVISAAMIRNHQPTLRDNTIFWSVTIAALLPWALLIWKGT